MNRLLVFYSTNEPMELVPGESGYLDRRFLTGGDDDPTVSRRPNSPMLFGQQGTWFIRNQHPTRELVLNRSLPEGGFSPCVVPTRGAVELPEESFVVLPGNRKVEFVIEGAMPPRIDPGAGSITYDADLERQVTEFLDKRRGARTIVALRFRPLLLDRLYGQPLKAHEVELCDPTLSTGRVNQVQKDLKTLTGRDVEPLGRWLVDRSIIVSTDMNGLPHEQCGH